MQKETSVGIDLYLIRHGESLANINQIGLTLLEYLSSYVPKNGEIYKISISKQE